ncbi:protein of unknown function [Shewanella benthica]|uniref:Uncharacterized protein n=1 Tax=Shewanella benthica TaxID=43661 RepID=A0A330M7W7_9GAMM|nr:protein of unknown function [Shewanella benthica]
MKDYLNLHSQEARLVTKWVIFSIVCNTNVGGCVVILSIDAKLVMREMLGVGGRSQITKNN